MSVRSELLFAAQKKILNPFLLCAVTSTRARQLMVARDGRAAVAELLDYALNEIAAGGLEFIADGENRRHKLSRRPRQNLEVRLKFREWKRRSRHAWFHYATEQEDWLWFHPWRRWL